jgi:glycosyltransferase involved in cell wall biosynthesis
MLDRAVNSILRRARRSPGDPINVGVFIAHEGWESDCAKMPGVNFYGIWTEGLKNWNTAYRPIPPNYKIIDIKGNLAAIPTEVELDLILSHNVFASAPHAHQLSQILNVPWISWEHCVRLCHGQQYDFYRDISLKANRKVFISKWSMENWGFDESNAAFINHGIDTERYTPSGNKEPFILTCANDFINRGNLLGYELLTQVCKGLPLVILGDTPNLSKGARDEADLINHYQRAAIYFNPSQLSTIPRSMLEAMSCSAACVTAETCAIPSLLTHNVDCLMSNDPATLRSYLMKLLNNNSERQRLGNGARHCIETKLNLKRFLVETRNLFEEVILNYR